MTRRDLPCGSFHLRANTIWTSRRLSLSTRLFPSGVRSLRVLELPPAFWPSDTKQATQWMRWPKIMVANAPKSKERSVASSPSPPEQIVFFTDENLGRHTVPEALRLAGEQVIAFYERFSSGTRDQVWLPEVGRNRWILLTKDSRIRYRRNEMQALLASKTRSFVLVSSNLPGSRSEEHTSELQSQSNLVCRRLLETKALALC